MVNQQKLQDLRNYKFIKDLPPTIQKAFEKLILLYENGKINDATVDTLIDKIYQSWFQKVPDSQRKRVSGMSAYSTPTRSVIRKSKSPSTVSVSTFSTSSTSSTSPHESWKTYFTKGHKHSLPMDHKHFPKVYDLAKENPLDNYEVRKPLGKGAFGLVYSVKDKTTGQKYALKEVRLKRDLEHAKTSDEIRRVLKKTLQEFEYLKIVAEKMGVTCIPYLACVHDIKFAHNNGQKPVLYIWMDQYDMDLHKWRKTYGQPSNEQLVRWIKQWTAGLKVLHDAGMVHRDIKPANMLLKYNEHDKMWDIYLSDFGAICDFKNAKTTKGCDELSTTFWYADPYMYYTGKADIRADWYAIGWSLYFAITGKYHVNADEDSWMSEWMNSPNDIRAKLINVKGRPVPYLQTEWYADFKSIWNRNFKVSTPKGINSKIWEYAKALTHPDTNQRNHLIPNFLKTKTVHPSISSSSEDYFLGRQ